MSAEPPDTDERAAEQMPKPAAPEQVRPEPVAPEQVPPEQPPEQVPPVQPPRVRGQHRRIDSAPRAGMPMVTVVLLALCVVAAAFAVFFGIDRPSSSSVPDSSLTGPAARAATAAARQATSQVLSYSYKSIASDIRQAEADATGLFLRQYRSTASRLLTEARQEKAIVQARVGQSGVVSAGPGNVVVLLYVDQATVRQPGGPSSNTTRIDQSRVRVTMTKVGSRWLISQLAAL